MANEITKVPPAVTDFLSDYHNIREEHSKALQKIEDQEHMIATLDQQIEGYRKIIEELSSKSDKYYALCIEMRTHFNCLQSMCREAEKAFVTAPYRKLQDVADDINQNENKEVKEEEKAPEWLGNKERANRLDDLKADKKKKTIVDIVTGK